MKQIYQQGLKKIKEYSIQKVLHIKGRIFTAIKWIIFSVLSGLIIGLIGTLFYLATTAATAVRAEYPWLIVLLPLGGVGIVWLYRLFHNEEDTGTNLVLSAIHSEKEIPIKSAPLIFISTVATQLLGGSAGREGAALQLGGSIGNALGKLFRFDEKDQHIMIMCGMSAAFSALFGTPMASAIFSMEVVSVGIMYYAALVPCVIASFVAHAVAVGLGASYTSFEIHNIPAFDLKTAILISVLAVGCAAVSILFCIVLRKTEKLYNHYLHNTYVRAAAGGALILILTLLVGNQNYNGAGIESIQGFLDGKVIPEAFIMKILFTAVTLGAGYKGGEIIPSFYIGASFGALFGMISGFAPSLCTAVGMGAVFCGVTNCPITSLLICFELFGYNGMPYYLLAIALSYMMSGYYGLYSSQKIMYSKYKTTYINRKTH